MSKDRTLRVAMLPTADLNSEWGSALHARMLADCLVEAGVNVDVFCKNPPARPDERIDFREVQLPLSHPVMIDPAITSGILASQVTALTNAVVAADSQSSYDLVHAHYATLNALAGVLVRTITGIPLVVSSFGRDLTVGASADKRYARMVRLTLDEADAVIAGDEGVANCLLTEFGVAEERITIIPMGVDEAVFQKVPVNRGLRLELGAGDHRKLIVAVCSCFSPEKGIDVLLRATRRVIDAGLDVAVAIIGKDDFEDLRCEQSLRDLVTALDLSGFVTFIGPVPNRSIPDYLGAADVVVDARTVSNYSSSTLEALFAGAFVVASDVAGNCKWIDSGRNGLLHRAGDEASLASQLRHCLTDIDLRRRVASGCISWRAEEGKRFTSHAMSDLVLGVYQQIAQERV